MTPSASSSATTARTLCPGFMKRGVGLRQRERRLEVLHRRLPVARSWRAARRASRVAAYSSPGPALDRRGGPRGPALRPAPSASSTNTLASSCERSGISAIFCPGQTVSPTKVVSPRQLRSRTSEPVVGGGDAERRAGPSPRSRTLSRGLARVDLAERAVGRGELAARVELAGPPRRPSSSKSSRSSCDSMIWLPRVELLVGELEGLGAVELLLRHVAVEARATSRSSPPSAFALSIFARAAARSACPSAASRCAS